MFSKNSLRLLKIRADESLNLTLRRSFQGSPALIVPSDLHSFLYSGFYPVVPPIRKGTDARFGFGYRLGAHADSQLLLELGPQKDTRPVSINEEGSSLGRKRQLKINKYRKISTTTSAEEEPSKNFSRLRNQTTATPDRLENLFNNNSTSSRNREANLNESGRTSTTTTTENPNSLFSWLRNDRKSTEAVNTNFLRWLGYWMTEMAKPPPKANRQSQKNNSREPPRKKFLKSTSKISESSLKTLQQLYKMATTTEANIVNESS